MITLIPPCEVIRSYSLRVFKLKSLNLEAGVKLLPSKVMTGGFQSLQTLSLSLDLHEQSSLLDLFTESSFPRLKKLNLEVFYGMKHLKVS